MNKESKAYKIRKITLDLLGDGNIHTTKEIMEAVVNKKIIVDKKTDIVYNVLFYMKKEGLIAPGPNKAEYILGEASVYRSNREVKKRQKEDDTKVVKEYKLDAGVSTLKLDTSKFSLLQPQTARYSQMVLTVKEKGELKMNSALMNKIKERDVEIFVSKDCRTIILNPLGTCSHKFTKAGTAKNREIVSMLRKLRIKFPISYIVEWNESICAWEGVLDINAKV